MDDSADLTHGKRKGGEEVFRKVQAGAGACGHVQTGNLKVRSGINGRQKAGRESIR